MYPHVAGKTSGGIRQIEIESIQECISRENHFQPALYKHIGTRYVYNVEDEKEFMLLLIETGLDYKKVDTKYEF